MKESQLQFVEATLRTDGEITRNQCLRIYITRLSAIIFKLQDNGYVIETDKVPTITRWGKGYDFKYIVKFKPKIPVYID